MKIILITPDKKRDYTTELIVEGLKELGHELYASSPGNGISEGYSDDYLYQISNSADLVISFFGKIRDNAPPRHYLVSQLLDKNKRAHVDGSEWTNSGYPEKNQIQLSLSDPNKRRSNNWIDQKMFEVCQYYFKRETYEIDLGKGIIPLPFGLSKRHIINPTQEKDIDVFCSYGHFLTGMRKETHDYCLNLSKNKNYKVIVGNNFSHDEYRNLLSRSKIVIDAWGGGDNCDRFYEAIGAKACCLYQRYNTIVPNPFIEGTHAYSYSNIDEFSESLNFLLSNPNLCSEIGENGFQHALNYHSSVYRAQTILSKFV